MSTSLAVSIAVLALAAGLAGCGTSAEGTATTAATPTSTTAAGSAGRTEATTTVPMELSDENEAAAAFTIVDTGQTSFYGNDGEIAEPGEADLFFGQDATYSGNEPSYTDNGDGTVTDNVTGLMWTQTPSQNLTYDEAVADADEREVAGYGDWRLPTIKELYSLILFTGTDPSGCDERQLDCDEAVPFIDTDYFEFSYGDTSAGERMIDAQYLSSTLYGGDGVGAMAFGVNFADGRIKGYGLTLRGADKTFDVLYVRGESGYGDNDFFENEDGTITDQATGLTWTQTDSGESLSWQDALSYCTTLDKAGVDDWRLPDVKELQSIVDYARSPSATESAAISPLFLLSEIIDEGGDVNYPYLWSSTSHVNVGGGSNGAYVAFGEALGWMQSPSGGYDLLDVHGAGAQRSDPKVGDASDYPYGHGPQGDVIRIDNYAVCVTG